MDIKWKDGEGNILNANKERIIYFDADENIKTTLKKDEIRKITIDDGLMNIFKDFENDLALTIVIPRKSKRNAVKIFNQYDRTGIILKGKSGNILIDLILESSVILGNPFMGIFIFIGIFAIALSLITLGFISVFGESGATLVRLFCGSYILYSIGSYIWLRVKRIKLKEI